MPPADDAVTLAAGVTFAPTVTVQQAPPELLSQGNVEAVCGITARTYLRELLPLYREAGGDVAERGKARLVRREDFCRWLMAGSKAVAPAPTKESGVKADTADAIAAELGLRVVAGGRGK